MELGFRVESVAARHGESSGPMYGKEGFRYPLSTKYNGLVAFAPPRKRSGRRQETGAGTAWEIAPVWIAPARSAGTPR
jgi:hypothetical protein